jgi:hypothetical protein
VIKTNKSCKINVEKVESSYNSSEILNKKKQSKVTNEYFQLFLFQIHTLELLLLLIFNKYLYN